MYADSLSNRLVSSVMGDEGADGLSDVSSSTNPRPGVSGVCGATEE